jgi:hypothetical protein
VPGLTADVSPAQPQVKDAYQRKMTALVDLNLNGPDSFRY